MCVVLSSQVMLLALCERPSAAPAGIHWQDRCGDSFTVRLCEVSRGVPAERECQPTSLCPLQAGDARLQLMKLAIPTL